MIESYATLTKQFHAIVYRGLTSVVRSRKSKRNWFAEKSHFTLESTRCTLMKTTLSVNGPPSPPRIAVPRSDATRPGSSFLELISKQVRDDRVRDFQKPMSG